MKVVSIIGQKGGCGKTSITIMLASTLAYKYGKNVVALDCDTYQQSMSQCRVDDIEMIKPYERENENGEKEMMVEQYTMYNAFIQQQKKMYEIVKCSEDVNAIMDVLDKREADGAEYVFLDLPGHVANEDNFKIVSLCDVVFVPFTVSKFVFSSNYSFAKTVHDKVLPADCQLNEMYGFWNRYDASLRQQLYAKLNEKLANDLPNMKMLNNKIAETSAFENEKCKSTILPPFAQQWKYGNIGETLTEMCNIIMKE